MKLEKSLQDQCLEYLKERGVYCANNHGDAWTRRGRPDLYICHKGRFIGCELKRPGRERPTKLQEKHLRDIKRNGGVGVWITSLEELRVLLCSLDSTANC